MLVKFVGNLCVNDLIKVPCRFQYFTLSSYLNKKVRVSSRVRVRSEMLGLSESESESESVNESEIDGFGAGVAKLNTSAS